MAEGRDALKQSAVIEKPPSETDDTDALISAILDDWIEGEFSDDDHQPSSSMVESLLERVSIACYASKDFTRKFIFRAAAEAFDKM
jgi:hypothetical protein